jgi:hypothetical protein
MTVHPSLRPAAESVTAPIPADSDRGDERDDDREARIFYSALGANVLLALKATIAHHEARR